MGGGLDDDFVSWLSVGFDRQLIGHRTRWNKNGCLFPEDLGRLLLKGVDRWVFSINIVTYLSPLSPSAFGSVGWLRCHLRSINFSMCPPQKMSNVEIENFCHWQVGWKPHISLLILRIFCCTLTFQVVEVPEAGSCRGAGSSDIEPGN
jgi:hypothetical protein